MTDYYSSDYKTAQKRFRETASIVGARLDELKLDCTAPDGSPLSIDIAWLGDLSPAKMIVHSSGLHGVEGFAGSAVQLKILANPPPLTRGSALALVHILNPFGMAWLRRTNENNVDLNRNCLHPEEKWEGVSDIYMRLNKILNPDTPPAPDLFLLHAFTNLFRHGMKKIKQALAEGQYEFSRGLFYGGKSLEQGPQLYQRWIQENLTSVEKLIAIDFHTGLGKWCQESLFVFWPEEETSFICKPLQRKFVYEDGGKVGYKIRGGLGSLFREFRSKGVFIFQEMGSRPGLEVLTAMREENRWHFYGEGNIDHSVKEKMKEVFCPNSEKWRSFILDRGVALIEDGVKIL